MSNISYHCPSCGSALKFYPNEGEFICQYCESKFNRYDLETQTGDVNRTNIQEEDELQEIAEYTCNSCGAHIITAPTTVATECYYCHNTVIMKKSMVSNVLPKRIIPFKMDKEVAKEEFKKWIFKKNYIPKEFREDKYIENMQAVYFPYWLVDVDADFTYYINMYVKTSERRSGDNARFTETYRVEKEGRIHMEDIMMAALKKSQRKLIEGVQPFDEAGMEPFTMTYLSGFQAEQKDIEVSELNNTDTLKLFERYAEKTLDCTLNKFNTYDKKHFSFDLKQAKWEYSLMPIWLITYKYKNEMYYFAMNGQTGKTCGRIPIDKPKLIRNTLLIFLSIFGFVFTLMFVLWFLSGGAV